MFQGHMETRASCTPLIEGKNGQSPLWSLGIFNNFRAESINHTKKNGLISLSEQELVDCDNERNQGCGITTECDALLTEEANQPVSIVIDTGISISKLNHDDAVVGYGTTLFKTKYRILKNSWGAKLGEKGYTRKRDRVELLRRLGGPSKNSSSSPARPSDSLTHSKQRSLLSLALLCISAD
ncbi:hypothetical protein CUMW_103100 [Citrus unshiu]|nr:hypothetical protein CUMW_103100 [Citrus unshiu]